MAKSKKEIPVEEPKEKQADVKAPDGQIVGELGDGEVGELIKEEVDNWEPATGAVVPPAVETPPAEPAPAHTTVEPKAPDEKVHGVSGIVHDSKPLVVSTGNITFSSNHQQKEVDKSLVKVLVKYPDDYKGNMYFTDGEIKEVSAESAKIFIDQKIATLVDAD